MFVLARPIWMLLNPRETSKGERHRQKETFSATSKPALLLPPPLPPHPPLWGNHRQGRAEGCCFLFTQALCYPGSLSPPPLLGPPVPSSPPHPPPSDTITICPSGVIKLFPSSPLFIILCCPSSYPPFPVTLHYLLPILFLCSVSSPPSFNHSLILLSIFLIILHPPASPPLPLPLPAELQQAVIDQLNRRR